MKKMKRRIVAMSTALVMAFAMIAAFVPTTINAAERQTISQLNLNVTVPKAGTYLSGAFDFQQNSSIDILGSQPVEVFQSPYQIKEDGTAFTYKDYPTTIEAGKTYYVQVSLAFNEPGKYYFDTPENMKVNISGAEFVKCSHLQNVIEDGDTGETTVIDDPTGLLVTYKFIPEGSGDNGDNGNNGNNVNNDNSSVTGSDSATGSSNEASTSSTSGSSASKATTTKASTPKTADAVPVVGFALVLAGAAAVGVVVYRRRTHS